MIHANGGGVGDQNCSWTGVVTIACGLGVTCLIEIPFDLFVVNLILSCCFYIFLLSHINHFAKTKSVHEYRPANCPTKNQLAESILNKALHRTRPSLFIYCLMFYFLLFQSWVSCWSVTPQPVPRTMPPLQVLLFWKITMFRNSGLTGMDFFTCDPKSAFWTLDGFSFVCFGCFTVLILGLSFFFSCDEIWRFLFFFPGKCTVLYLAWFWLPSFLFIFFSVTVLMLLWGSNLLGQRVPTIHQNSMCTLPMSDDECLSKVILLVLCWMFCPAKGLASPLA